MPIGRNVPGMDGATAYGTQRGVCYFPRCETGLGATGEGGEPCHLHCDSTLALSASNLGLGGGWDDEVKLTPHLPQAHVG